MKTLSILLFQSLLLFSQLRASTIHAILAVNTTVEDISFSTRSDLIQARNNLELIAELCELELVTHELIDERFNANDLLCSIDALELEEEDCVFFYYSGHGFRTQRNSSELPALNFGSKLAAIDLASVVERLECKLPRLLIVLADCCNTRLGSWSRPWLRQQSKRWSWGPMKDYSDENLYQLFVLFEGLVVGVAAQPSDPAASLMEGGLFTVTFWDTLFSRARDCKELDWETVLQETQTRTYYNTVMPGFQLPIYFIFSDL